MENVLPPIKVIRQDAVIKLNIGTGMIERLQEVIGYFAKQITDEDLAKYQEEFKDYQKIAKKEKEFSQPWMYPVTTLSFLLQEIEKQADLQGFTSEMQMEEYVKSKIDKPDSFTAKDNQSAPQSQSQPE